MSQVQRHLLSSEEDLRLHSGPLGVLESADSQLRLSGLHRGLALEATATSAGDSFVMTVSGSFRGTPVPRLGLATGPLDRLVDELLGLVPGWSTDADRDEETEAQRARRWPWINDAVFFGDVPLLAALVREGDGDGIRAALEVTDLEEVPEWLREGAFGLDGSLALSISHLDLYSNRVELQWIWQAQLFPSGWVSLALDDHDEVTATPLTADDVQSAVIGACGGLVRGTHRERSA